MSKSKAPKSPRIRLDVTAEIIAASLVAGIKDSAHCMISEALKAARPGCKGVAADLATIRFTDGKRGLRYTYLTPRVAQVQLVNFDQGRKPEPFSFVLRGAHVTRKGATKPPKDLPEEERQRRTEAGKKLNANLKKTRLARGDSGNGTVPDRIGGAAPPLQRGVDGVPFSRRRAFGLRALEY